MKQKTKEQLSATVEVFKAADAYLAQQKKVEDAFIALKEEQDKIEKEHKALRASAGSIEASRLLGETEGIDTASLNDSLLQMRDQQDRLIAAWDALEERKKVLAEQLTVQAAATNRALSDLTNMIRAELNEEMTKAVKQLTAIVNRYYALYSGSHYGSLYHREVFEMEIPSLVDRKNLFQPPVRHHPRTHEVLGSAWRDDPDAVQLHDQLDALGRTNQLLQHMEKQMLDARVAV